MTRDDEEHFCVRGESSGDSWLPRNTSLKSAVTPPHSQNKWKWMRRNPSTSNTVIQDYVRGTRGHWNPLLSSTSVF